MNFYAPNEIKIFKILLDNAGCLEIFCRTPSETDWYNPGLIIKNIQEDCVIYFPRVKLDQVIPVDIKPVLVGNIKKMQDLDMNEFISKWGIPNIAKLYFVYGVLGRLIICDDAEMRQIWPE